MSADKDRQIFTYGPCHGCQLETGLVVWPDERLYCERCMRITPEFRRAPMVQQTDLIAAFKNSLPGLIERARLEQWLLRSFGQARYDVVTRQAALVGRPYTTPKPPYKP